MQNKASKLLGFIFLLLFSLPSFAGHAQLSDRRDVNAFIEKMVDKYDFNTMYLVHLFRQVNIRADILALMNRPKESSPWFSYRRFFITESRVENGVVFWNQHAGTLAAVQNKYGVPANLIVAVIGVETNYGGYIGRYRVIDALSTLAFNYPPRQNFFRKELEQYLLLSREQGFDPLKITGSYAGAIGVPQFMPSSYRSYAVSFNGNRKIDLLNNKNDAIISVANYFSKYGWQPGQPIVVPAIVSGNLYPTLLNNGFKPNLTLAELKKYGVRSSVNLPPTTKAILIQLQNPIKMEYWLGLNNFYVISTYNPSLNYTMATYQLSQIIEARRTKNLSSLRA